MNSGQASSQWTARGTSAVSRPDYQRCHFCMFLVDVVLERSADKYKKLLRECAPEALDAKNDRDSARGASAGHRFSHVPRAGHHLAISWGYDRRFSGWPFSRGTGACLESRAGLVRFRERCAHCLLLQAWEAIKMQWPLLMTADTLLAIQAKHKQRRCQALNQAWFSQAAATCLVACMLQASALSGNAETSRGSVCTFAIRHEQFLLACMFVFTSHSMH